MTAVPTVARWWRTRSDPQRIELYTRWSYYPTLVALPVLLLFAVAPSWSAVGLGPIATTVLSGTLLIAALATTVALLWLTRRSFALRVDGGRLPGRAIALAAAAGAALVVAGELAVLRAPGVTPGAPWVVGLVGAGFLLTLSVTWDMRRLAWGALAIAAVAGIASGLDGNPPWAATVTGLSVAVALVAMAGAFRFTVWILDVVQQMERTRGVQLQLAVAEERLRFARDLHDVMGRNLSAIAVKSRLAGELSRRGREGAPTEMDDVAALAESSLREVREVVRGYRATDLAAELAGARSVLRAAGVTTTITGEDGVGGLPPGMQELLGWVVREAVTNVLRHSPADACRIELTTDGGGTTLTVRDDGAAGPAGWGSGLTGLAERVAAAGGRLAAGPGPDGFAVTARVPT